ncbi:MAG: phosphate/phosphite/phosphonate transporter substrate-binding protein [Caulobacteraceae bacterium]|jgi:phosphonate transport system substrate-binding protein|nr:phosphate/phosphite/phosphonate transporter substrate-binding protein [Caulobacteraceae bacterium]
MITRRRVAALAGSTLALVGCGKTGHATQSVPVGEVHFSVLSTESTQAMSRYWQPILEDMRKQTGLKITPYYSNNYTLLVEALRFKKTDAGWFSNQSGLEAVRRGGGEVFARTFSPSGIDGYTSVLIVNAKNPLTLDKVLKCNKTLSFGLGDVLSTSGTLAPMTYLFAPRDIRPMDCFKQVRSGSSHQANLVAVANGQLDVATNNSTSLMLDKQNGGHEADRVRVIWRSPVLPEDPIIWRRDLDPRVKEKLRQFFLTYGQGDSPEAARARGYMAKVHVGGFKPADDNHLLPVREMEATEHWLQAKDGGDPKRIAEAKAALDGIHAQRVALEARTRAPAAAQ